MDPNAGPAAAVAPQDAASFFDHILENAPDDSAQAFQYFQAALGQLQQFAQDPKFPVLKLLLQGFCLLNQGTYAISTADFAAASSILESASAQFSQAGDANSADFCKGLQMVAQANVEIRNQNLGAGQNLLTEAQKLLARDPDMSLKYAPVIDDIVCGSLSLSAIQAAQSMTFSEAKVLTEEASAKFEAYAHKYLPEGSPIHYYYLGQAKFLRAYYLFFKAQWDFGAFSFDDTLADEDLARTAREARALLSQAAALPIVADTYQINEAFCGMLEILPSASKLADALLHGKPAPPIDYTTLQAHLKAATDSVAAGGKRTLLAFRLCEKFSETLENLRKIDSERAKPIARPSDPKTPIHLFIIMPFAEQSAVVEQALRAVLEDDPYCFKLTLARDSTLAPNLLDNVKAHMYTADAFLADISGLNPNVMMELGMVESDPAQRPVFVLKRKLEKNKKEPEVPSDLKGRLYIEYEIAATDSPEEKARRLTADLKKGLSTWAELGKLSERPHVRYTSLQYMQRKLQQKRLSLSNDELALLQDRFPSIEELEAATAVQVAMKTGFEEDVAQSVVKAFATASSGSV